VSLANRSSSSLDELVASELEEISASEELDSSSAEDAISALEEVGCSDELDSSADVADELADSSSLELLLTASAEESGSGANDAETCELESLPQLAQNKDATDKLPRRTNLRIFMFPPFP
jgi:hypothetical protein